MFIQYDEPVYRPPSEAGSLILQATSGCSHNRCAFCQMYKGKRFAVKEWKVLKGEIDAAKRYLPETARIFLGDGDAFVLATEKLERILDYLAGSFPRLQRVSAYANPSNLLGKSVGEMTRLREKGLKIIYYGVETGDPELLLMTGKGATPGEMIEGCAKAREAGLKISATVITGLGGSERSLRHARMTGELVSRLEPRYLSALTLMLGPFEEEYIKLFGPGFRMNTPAEDLLELREMISRLENDRCIFRSNHASNYLALKGTLRKDREALVATIDRALDDPGRYLRKEWMRGL
ncbi:MAG: radical SAM protein [Candidatus Krumholzibacteriota bacterium]|nr:radical SAM protein [Candidatus Krumholzibacteriota bacterium]